MTPQAPLVHIVCCFLNAEPYLDEAIESVRQQTCTDWRLVLVDDGSTDGSTEIARRHAADDPRISYRDHPDHRNIGLPGSRNAGMSDCQSPFMAFIDADDRWTLDKLSDQLAIMSANPDVGLVSGASVYWNSWRGGADRTYLAGHAQDQVIAPPEALLNVYPLGRAQAPPPSVILVRRTAFVEVGGFESAFAGKLSTYEDQAFLSKVYLSSPVFFSRKAWLYYRQHDTSLMADMRGTGTYDTVRRYFLEWLLAYVRLRPSTDPRVARAIGRALFIYRVPALLSLRRSRFLRAMKRQISALLRPATR